MNLFTSDRERRLWYWVLATVVGIYSTLGLARSIAGFLRDKNLIEGLFGFGMILIVAAIIIQGLKKQRSGTEVFIGLGIIGVYLIVFTRMAIPEERTHLIEYSVLAILILEALRERSNQGRKMPYLAILAILMTSTIGVIDECIQAFLPSRVFDPFDILFNVLASIMAVLGSLVIAWARRLSSTSKN
ncbi:MAG: VanZ family protein [Saprospiraceae bacterium]|jgi:hypothetical protein|nr:VanZ family protein [Saprospiraceae bacterium]